MIVIASLTHWDRGPDDFQDKPETRNLMLSALSRGSVTAATLTWEKFYSSSVEVDPTLLDRISEEEYRIQYRAFVRRVETMGRDPGRKDKSNKELLEVLLDPAYNLFKDIEAVMSVLVRASLLISVRGERGRVLDQHNGTSCLPEENNGRDAPP